MARSTSTGLYTRVDNSFSNPVVGTTISPTDADTYFDDIDAGMNSFIGTSTTSLAIALGSKTFTVATPATKVFLPNTQIHAFSLANSANYMDCTVASYNSTTGALVTTCFALGGSGTITDWVIITSGARGGAGPIAGIRQLYSSTTTDADPGAGTFRLNNATPSSATAAYLDNVDTNGTTVTTILDKWDDSTTTTKGYVRFEKESDSSVWADFTVTGSVVDGTGYRKLTLSAGSGSGSFTAGDAFRIAFFPTGDKGTNGSGTFPASSTDNAAVRFDGTGGTTVQNSGVIIDDSNNVSGVATLTTTGNIELGNASDTTLSRLSGGRLGVEGVALDPHIPQNSKSAAYTTVIGDANSHIYHPSSDNNARTFTIDSNANVPYPIGTFITFINEINTVTISITSDTLVLAGTGATGSRTLAANGVATAVKVTSTRWYISGTGLT